MPTVYSIEIAQFKYNPPDLAIEVGDAVKWINRDPSGHTATRNAAPTFDTGPLATDQESAPITFTDASDVNGFEYFCGPHPFMKAKVIVTLPGANRSSYSLSAAEAMHAHQSTKKHKT